jgi:DNA-binding transcriptional MerR regulator
MVQFVNYTAMRVGIPLVGLPFELVMPMPLAQKRAVEPPAIPDRLYFKIGDVARICSEKAYVLRFWETQFPQLKPNKSGTGQRLYRRRDVELLLRIKQLVHEEGYTIAGARLALEQAPRAKTAASQETQHDPQSLFPMPVADAPARTPDSVATTLQLARAELREIIDLLADREAQPGRKRSRVATMPTASGLLFPV